MLNRYVIVSNALDVERMNDEAHLTWLGIGI